MACTDKTSEDKGAVAQSIAAEPLWSAGWEEAAGRGRRKARSWPGPNMREQRVRGVKRCVGNQSCSQDGVLRCERDRKEHSRRRSGICVRRIKQDDGRGNVARIVWHAAQGGAAARVR